MARRPRWDASGLDLHITNRGGAKRTVLEERPDFRYFKSLMARAVRRGEIEIHAFALMMNHFHILLRSHGQLSDAIRRIQNMYVRYFNRTRMRDGPLFRGRFVSKPILTVSYRRNVLHYIHENPVRAGLVQRAEDWEWGSAWHFAQGKLPLWLSTSAWDAFGGGEAGEAVSSEVGRVRAELIESRLRRSSAGADPLDELLSGVPERVWRWMIRKADLADGTKPGIPAAGAGTVERALASLAPEASDRRVRLAGAHCQPLGLLLRVGLLRDMAALTFAEVARRVERGAPTTKHLFELHTRALREDEYYGRLAQDRVEACVRPLRE